jgi:polyisoprenoid-binding protein YceI
MGKKTDQIIRSAIASALTLMTTNATLASNTTPKETEKCFGIVKAQMNDCQTTTHSCAASATKDRQPDAFIFLPTGLCKKIVGGSLALGENTDKTAAQTYILDPMHTYVLWHINHFGFSQPSGKWMANGTLYFDDLKVENSKVEVTINVADIVTGIPELDKHLKSKLFFDVADFPIAKFVSDKVVSSDPANMKVHGTLTVHGISKEIELKTRLNKKGKSPISDKETVGFSGEVQLRRSDFGINTLLPGLSDEVNIEIEVEAYKN